MSKTTARVIPCMISRLCNRFSRILLICLPVLGMFFLGEPVWAQGPYRSWWNLKLRAAGYTEDEIREIRTTPDGFRRVQSRWRLMATGFCRTEVYRLIPEAVPRPYRSLRKVAGPVGFRPAPLPLIRKVLRPYRHVIERTADRYGIPVSLVQAVIVVESGGDFRAVSCKGALGLMQLMPETAEDMGVEDPYCPYQNIEGGCRYLRMMWDQFKPRWKWALAAYNAGPTRVVEAAGIPNIPETVRYVTKVLATRRLLGEGMKS